MDIERPNKFLPFLLRLVDTSKRLWWQFFDWLAIVSWAYLVFISIICLFIAGILGLGGIAPLLVFSSFLIKSLAGGKRRAEIAASAAAIRANMEALERRVLEAEMASLQAQIEPHFLFNTLALIGQLIETQPEQASIVHNHLIKYLRAALPQIREKGNSKLGQQIELCRAYLAIMQARMQERLEFSIDCPKDLEQFSFPPMMIQTLVENAIKHGLEPKTDGGHIHIHAYQGENEVIVSVTDTGLGFDLQAEEGIGLSNIRERLKVLYGFRAALLIEVPEIGGAQLSLHIPA